MALDFKNYDQRKYPSVGVTEGYANWSKTYESHISDYLDMSLLNRLHTIS